MCEFCARHGDGGAWYLNAANYAADLTSDLERRGYIVEFVRTFSDRMPAHIERLGRLRQAPAPVAQRGTRLLLEHQRRTHWGQPLPIEDCERIFDFATRIVQVPCVCRRFAGAPERGYCLLVATQPMDDVLMEAFPEYADGPDSDAFQELTRAEAMALLRRTEHEGMMHSIWTFMTPFTAGLCNCDLDGGCIAMRAAVEFDIPNMWKGEYVAGVDRDACTGCLACVDHCPFGVIGHDVANARAVIGPEACWGCGTCRVACPEDAIALAPRRPAVGPDPSADGRLVS